MALLDTLPFQIFGWYGPNEKFLSKQTLSELVNAGFNSTLVNLQEDDIERGLNDAAAVGIRLCIIPKGVISLWRTPGTVDEAMQQRFTNVIKKYEGHPGLLGWVAIDEPMADVFDDIGRLHAAWKAANSQSLFYVNHWMTNQSFAKARSYEDLWERLQNVAPLAFVSADGYPFFHCTEEEWLAGKGKPEFYPRHKARILLHYFEMLDIQRQFALRWNVPMWAFTFARGCYSSATVEGEMRFQVMTALAYGAKAIQYFAVEHQEMLLDKHGKGTDNLRAAAKINAVLRTWGPTLLSLRSIGVYHYPHDLPYTRPLDNFMLGAPTDLFARGDAVCVGHFVDSEDNEYVLIVNRSPFEPATSIFSFGTSKIVECDPRDATWSPVETKDGGFKATLHLEPGAGRLFRFKREIGK